MLDIPLEIKLAIIDNLASAVRDPLSGVALVWPEVIFRIRERRFSAVSLSTTRKLHLLSEILEGSPSLCPIVHTVVIPAGAFTRSVYDSPDLPRLFKLLKKLTNVVFYSVDPLTQPHTVDAFQCLPNTITYVDLHIYQKTVHPPPEPLSKTLELLRAFPCVETLKLECNPDVGPSLGSDAINSVIAKPFTSLRTLFLFNRQFLKSASMPALMERGLFPNLESLTIKDERWDHRSVGVLDGLLRCWSNTLRELRVLGRGIAARTPGAPMFVLPPNLDVLKFEISFTVRRPPPGFDDGSYLDLWIRTLEQRCRSGATLRSLDILVEFSWPKIQKAGAQEIARFHQIDALLGSSELNAMHLKWHLVRDDGFVTFENEPGIYDETSLETACKWVNENIFPATSARFLTEAGRNRFGTTYTPTVTHL
ncbi:hypothetical protein CYLTODRAFT_489781 [Cylindrobasidium torrendii FP15055 ss-10]|uniref:F-box domain-containing protein n=1 Tax=Cylindrobasidium torrendii FP15055 ss-10 TaxID=1314674 RepID=A0A0D7BDZ7_9AGAR|nr:hypothetical protein CYLTODRAFT_489781 [Cylindrobasidium torrendii FP15055 ss-10]